MNEFLTSVLSSIQKTGTLLNIPEGILSILLTSKNSVEVSFPIVMDDGSVRTFTGWRVQYNDALGPYKGGIRFSPEASREEVTALAAVMTIKNAAIGLPYGGAKGGVRMAPWELSTRELEAVSRGYVRAIYKIIGPDVDVPAPDVNTNPVIMGWMMDEYSRIATHTVPAAFTGKPEELGGTNVRTIATGYGGYVIMREALRLFGWQKDPKDTTVAIQGFGNVGATIADILSEQGFHVVALSDAEGGIYDPGGINLDAVHKAQEKAGTIAKNRCYQKNLTASTKEMESCTPITNEQLLELSVDVLIPAAIEGVITKDNAERITSPIILEMANGAITAEAENILLAKKKTIIPDVIANSGGVAASYLEWVENRQGYPWEREAITTTLDTMMTKALTGAVRESKERNVSFREGAYIIAVERIIKAMKARGWLGA